MKRSHLRPAARATKRERVEAELAEKLRRQELLVDLFAPFVAQPSAQVEAAIEDTQRLIIETLGLDRSTLWQLDDHSDGLVLTHSWQRPGWPPLPHPMPMADHLPWTMAELMTGRMLRFSRVEDLPPEAARDEETFRLQGLKSGVMFPLMVHGRAFGALAFGTLGREHEWREDEITELKMVVQIIGNVVSRERAELREEQLREQLAHFMRVAALGELAATLTHELNQPLAAILSNAQAARRFLADGAIDAAELTAILDDIVRDDKRAGAVIHNLRTMVSKQPKPRERCSLNELATEVAALLRSEFIDAGIEARFTLAPELPAVEAVRVEMQQVLLNLLLNAVHAMGNTPFGQRFIDLETRVVNEGIEVCVRDRGHGIPAERLASIFDPFVSTKADGLGMGLSICRRIVESHGGRIAARNCDDGGARFTATFPLLPVVK